MKSSVLNARLPLTVQIVTYNSAATIQDCLHSVLAQIPAGKIYLWDNASSDDTVQLIQQIGLPVCESAVNIGYGAAHNRLFQQSDTPFVLTLNPDVMLQPGYIARLCQELTEQPDAGMAMGCLLRVNNLHDIPQQIDSLGLRMQRNRRVRLRGEQEPLDHCPTTAHDIWGADGAAVCYRRAMLTDIAHEGEVFDELFFMHKEDIDLCWRARLRGWRARLVPTAKAHHIRSFRPGQRGRVSARMRCLGVRNRYLLLLKNDYLTDILRHLLPILLYEMLILGYLVLMERSSLQSYRQLPSLLPGLLHRRQAIQSRRRVTRQTIRRWFH